MLILASDKMYNKCCVCNSSRQDTTLHRFPCAGKRLNKWLECINRDEFKKLSVEQLAKLFVCHKHFETKFITSKSRLICIAYPSLFSKDEIGSGIPTQVNAENVYIQTDHCYTIKRQHLDHTYCQLEALTDTAYGTKAADSANIEKCLDVQDLGPCSPNIHGVIDGYINDDDTHKETEDQLFSWQRTSEINCEDFDDNLDNSTIVEEISEINGVVFETENDSEINDLENTRSETDLRVLNRDEDNDVHEGYKCDMCKGAIRRFRYSCVECANYDLCGACEARNGHPQHYLLRVPRPRPHGEIQLIMDTIRRFLIADLKSLRAEANFVSTLMDEMKSEVFSEADSDPVPDEPDYPIQSDISSDENEDCEMEVSNASHASATHDDTQEYTYLYERDILEERDIPKETIDKNIINIASDREGDCQSRLSVQNENIKHKPEISSQVKQTDSLSPYNALNKVSKRLVLPKNYSRSPSNALGKVSKRILGTLPKTVSINNDVFKLLKATNDADTMRNTVNTIKHTLQSQVSIKLQRLSKEVLKTATNT